MGRPSLCGSRCRLHQACMAGDGPLELHLCRAGLEGGPISVRRRLLVSQGRL